MGKEIPVGIGQGELYQTIQTDMDQVEGVLQRVCETADTVIAQTMLPLIHAGGKRIRPALLVLSSKACGYTGERMIMLAAAIELLHTASLVHDDVIDNDTLRRGMTTVSARFGNSISVIIGDYLYALVLSIIAENSNNSILKNIAAAARCMAGGDLRQQRRQSDLCLTEEDYLAANQDKTAALMACACRIGALLAEADTKTVHALAGYGMNLGMAFQIIDDMLDITGDQTRIGKPLGSDIQEGKLTLPLIRTLQVADRRDKEWLNKTLTDRKFTQSVLAQVREMVHCYKAIEYSREKALQYTQKCKEIIAAVPQSNYRDLLCRFTDYVIERAG